MSAKRIQDSIKYKSTELSAEESIWKDSAMLRSRVMNWKYVNFDSNQLIYCLLYIESGSATEQYEFKDSCDLDKVRELPKVLVDFSQEMKHFTDEFRFIQSAHALIKNP
ncbi:MAG: hypothetical protein COT74_06105 [Bdellovibrionales bacterium CG10_big_fil_rev_8_21_14_0_10_45_34]|nr:MAG: hypothetical protein COT74_06105 [Bdellovibrionales bacterium CG10_big_fil_rev_8_21_14_0_10_45_34]